METIDPVLLVWHCVTNHSSCLTLRRAATAVSKMSVWLNGTAHLISSQVFKPIEYRIKNTGIGRVVSSPTCLFRAGTASKLDKVLSRVLSSQVLNTPSDTDYGRSFHHFSVHTVKDFFLKFASSFPCHSLWPVDSCPFTVHLW